MKFATHVSMVSIIFQIGPFPSVPDWPLKLDPDSNWSSFGTDFIGMAVTWSFFNEFSFRGQFGKIIDSGFWGVHFRKRKWQAAKKNDF